MYISAFDILHDPAPFFSRYPAGEEYTVNVLLAELFLENLAMGHPVRDYEYSSLVAFVNYPDYVTSYLGIAVFVGSKGFDKFGIITSEPVLEFRMHLNEFRTDNCTTFLKDPSVYSMQTVSHIRIYKLGHSIFTPERCCRETKHEITVKAVDNVSKQAGWHPVTFIHNYLAELSREGVQVFSDSIDNANCDGLDIVFAVASLASLDIEELGYSFLPLGQKLFVVDNYQGGLFPLSKNMKSHDGFSGTGSSLKYTERVFHDSIDSLLLVWPQCTVELEVNFRQAPTVVNNYR